MKTLLLSTYELGHQPFNLASPAAYLLRAGHEVRCLDLAVQELDAAQALAAEFIAISTPMHTALRLGVPLARRVRAINPRAHVCFFGLYAGLHAEYLLQNAADFVIGGEFEEAMVALVHTLAQRDIAPGFNTPLKGGIYRDAPRHDSSLERGVLARINTLETRNTHTNTRNLTQFPRQQFHLPARQLLPPLAHYAHLLIAGERRLAGYVEASRGCAHHCRHCPITPVYAGRVRLVQEQVVLDDIAQQVAMGARHITFGDPDFLNAAKYSLRLVRELHARWPELTCDFTAKIEHILQYENLFTEFAALGCVFVISAVECLNNEVLKILDKGHTRVDVERAFAITRAAGIPLRPSLMPFTPWSTSEDFIALLEFVQEHGLFAHFDPIQFSIRLLLPPGSALLNLPETRKQLCGFDEEKFAHAWKHPDPRMDELQVRVAALVEAASKRQENRRVTLTRIRELGYELVGKSMCAQMRLPPAPELDPPRLTEDWFC